MPVWVESPAVGLRCVRLRRATLAGVCGVALGLNGAAAAAPLAGSTVLVRAAVKARATVTPVAAEARARKAGGQGVTAWAEACELEEALTATPAETRTRAQYVRVLDAFRAIYHANPADVHAPEAVYRVAGLLAEESEVYGAGNAGLFGSVEAARHSVEAAVGQYEFLRKQYPVSSLRVPALLAEADLNQDRLHDAKTAREQYRELVRLYPASDSAEAARESLAGTRVAAGTARTTLAAASATSGMALPGLIAGKTGATGAEIEATAAQTQVPSTPVLAGGSLGQASEGGGTREADGMRAIGNDKQEKQRPQQIAVGNGKPGSPGDLQGQGQPTRRAGRPAAVTGIRHWSTPTYTRVAIDLGDQVTYEAARVPRPDRIYFDLHGTRLTQELVGKSFTVTDDGFLRKIRAAQFSNDVTRVVLDVSDVSEYSAFLLPNPYRLIIDIHGGKAGAGASSEGRGNGGVAAAGAEILPPAPTAAEAAGSSLPAIAATGAGAGGSGTGTSGARDGEMSAVGLADANARRGATATRGGHPGAKESGVGARDTARGQENAGGKGSAVVVKAASAKEVASLSERADKVEATSRPTSLPISAVVADGSIVTVATGSGAAAGGTLGSKPLAGGDLGLIGASSTAARATLPSSDQGSAKKPGRRGGKSAGTSEAAEASAATPVPAALRTADGQTSLVRALGLKVGRIVIDAGHGGHDSGTLGVDGIEEKDVVLDVALRLGKMLQDRLGSEVIYTRSDDTFIPLETRTAIANKAQADLFLSIHANSSSDATARGVETYYLNFTSDAGALDVAARENAVSNQSIHQLSDLVKKIALKEKIDESREFAGDVESGLYNGLQGQPGNAGLKNRGVKKAPFVVLIGANMPSVLAEISFVTNAKDAGKLKTPEYRQRVAESLYRGVSRYAGGLSGKKQTVERASGN